MSNQKTVWELYKEGTFKPGSVVKLNTGETVVVGEISDEDEVHKYFFFQAKNSDQVYESFSIESVISNEAPVRSSFFAENAAEQEMKRRALAQRVFEEVERKNNRAVKPLDSEIILPEIVNMDFPIRSAESNDSPIIKKQTSSSSQAEKKERKLAIPPIVLEQLNKHIHEKAAPVPELVAIADKMRLITHKTLINDLSESLIELSNILAKALESANKSSN